MKVFKMLAVAVLSLFLLPVNAQTEIPQGFKKGTINLAGGHVLSGFIRDNIRKNASVTFITGGQDKKKVYHGSDIISAEIEGVKYICINGDFFKVFCEGDLSFLQKSSDASGKPVYNGNEASFSNGTAGKPEDYFIYSTKDKQLTLLSKKNIDQVVSSSFAGCAAAIDQAKGINGDLSQLKAAVDVYNNRNK